uniref:SCAN domaincontaining protein 3like [Acyrthosiphon pisum] n=1 Tax=Lepeophtheirus salmonis TaxID=72036 RepID=A0A0K2V7X9_LEPSM
MFKPNMEQQLLLSLLPIPIFILEENLYLFIGGCCDRSLYCSQGGASLKKFGNPFYRSSFFFLFLC